jgi:phage gp16-like protein
MDNMTREEREACNPYPRKNYVISQCCSVDDLRCYLSNMRTETAEQRQAPMQNLTEAVTHERTERNRATIINMLNAKHKQVHKISFLNRDPNCK